MEKVSHTMEEILVLFCEIHDEIKEVNYKGY